MSARQADPAWGDIVEEVELVRELTRIEKKLKNIERLLVSCLNGKESYGIMKLSENPLRDLYEV